MFIKSREVWGGKSSGGREKKEGREQRGRTGGGRGEANGPERGGRRALASSKDLEQTFRGWSGDLVHPHELRNEGPGGVRRVGEHGPSSQRERGTRRLACLARWADRLLTWKSTAPFSGTFPGPTPSMTIGTECREGLQRSKIR